MDDALTPAELADQIGYVTDLKLAFLHGLGCSSRNALHDAISRYLSETQEGTESLDAILAEPWTD